MNCIIVDDEPLAREAIELLIAENGKLDIAGIFNNAMAASTYMMKNPVDLIFLDIQMPNITGLEFARMIPKTTLVIFTTAYADFALDSYEVDAIDYLVKPVEIERFNKAVDKAITYHLLLKDEEKEETGIGNIGHECVFVKSDRRYFKVLLNDILFIEGLKDYVIIQLRDQRIITRTSLKLMQERLPQAKFLRVNKSYIVHIDHIDSFDNNDIYIDKYEIGIGNSYRDMFFEEFVEKKDRL